MYSCDAFVCKAVVDFMWCDDIVKGTYLFETSTYGTLFGVMDVFLLVLNDVHPVLNCLNIVVSFRVKHSVNAFWIHLLPVSVTFAFNICTRHLKRHTRKQACMHTHTQIWFTFHKSSLFLNCVHLTLWFTGSTFWIQFPPCESLNIHFVSERFGLNIPLTSSVGY